MKMVVVGGQYGDEGKGKIVAHLATVDRPDIVARAGTGPNAGHTVLHNGREYGVRLIPCGFVNPNVQLRIGRGVLVNPDVFLSEVELTGTRGRAMIDRQAGLILPEDIEEDHKEHGKTIGTTQTGCGPAQARRVSRQEKTHVFDSEKLVSGGYLTDVAFEVNEAEHVLVEGSQGYMIGLYSPESPNVTSKSVNAGVAIDDVGIGPLDIDEVLIVAKAYTTRVGPGKFCEHEITPEEARKRGMYEEGTVTHRPRRICPELHFNDLRNARRDNSASQMALTKLDVVFPDAAGVTHFDALPDDARSFVRELEEKVDVDVTLIGTGRDERSIIDLRDAHRRMV